MCICSVIVYWNTHRLSSSSLSRAVQSRSLQNIQASRVVHIPETPYPVEDDAENLRRHFTAEGDLEDVPARMEKLRVTQEPVSQNYSQEERMGDFHIDPITGHIAALTWDPQQSERLRPHADDM